MPTSDGYSDYQQQHSYAHMPGVVIAASSSRTGQPRLVRVGGAYGTRTVGFTATRVGMPPVLPAAADTEGDKYIGGSISVPMPRANSRDGTYTFNASGSYVYLQNEVRVPGESPLPTGSTPFGAPVQDFAAYTRLSGIPGFDALLNGGTSSNPSRDLLNFAGLYDYDDEYPAEGWFLTGLPLQAFTTTTIAG